jgi:hypothetical protein
MIEILATAPDTSYLSLFQGDWIVFGVLGGIIWAIKDNCNFGGSQADDDEHYY